MVERRHRRIVQIGGRRPHTGERTGGIDFTALRVGVLVRVAQRRSERRRPFRRLTQGALFPERLRLHGHVVALVVAFLDLPECGRDGRRDRNGGLVRCHLDEALEVSRRVGIRLDLVEREELVLMQPGRCRAERLLVTAGALRAVDCAASLCLRAIDGAERRLWPARRVDRVRQLLERVHVVEPQVAGERLQFEKPAGAERLRDVALHHRIRIRAPVEPGGVAEAPEMRNARRSVRGLDVAGNRAEEQVRADAERVHTAESERRRRAGECFGHDFHNRGHRLEHAQLAQHAGERGLDHLARLRRAARGAIDHGGRKILACIEVGDGGIEGGPKAIGDRLNLLAARLESIREARQPRVLRAGGRCRGLGLAIEVDNPLEEALSPRGIAAGLDDGRPNRDDVAEGIGHAGPAVDAQRRAAIADLTGVTRGAIDAHKIDAGDGVDRQADRQAVRILIADAIGQPAEPLQILGERPAGRRRGFERIEPRERHVAAAGGEVIEALAVSGRPVGGDRRGFRGRRRLNRGRLATS